MGARIAVTGRPVTGRDRLLLLACVGVGWSRRARRRRRFDRRTPSRSSASGAGRAPIPEGGSRGGPGKTC